LDLERSIIVVLPVDRWGRLAGGVFVLRFNHFADDFQRLGSQGGWDVGADVSRLNERVDKVLHLNSVRPFKRIRRLPLNSNDRHHQVLKLLIQLRLHVIIGPRKFHEDLQLLRLTNLNHLGDLLPPVLPVTDTERSQVHIPTQVIQLGNLANCFHKQLNVTVVDGLGLVGNGHE
jgi:hypothetical protein